MIVVFAFMSRPARLHDAGGVEVSSLFSRSLVPSHWVNNLIFSLRITGKGKKEREGERVRDAISCPKSLLIKHWLSLGGYSHSILKDACFLCEISHSVVSLSSW